MPSEYVFTDNRINIHIDIEQTNIPIVHKYFMSENTKLFIGPQMRAPISYDELSVDYSVDIPP